MKQKINRMLDTAAEKISELEIKLRKSSRIHHKEKITNMNE